MTKQISQVKDLLQDTIYGSTDSLQPNTDVYTLSDHLMQSLAEDQRPTMARFLCVCRDQQAPVGGVSHEGWLWMATVGRGQVLRLFCPSVVKH